MSDSEGLARSRSRERTSQRPTAAPMRREHLPGPAQGTIKHNPMAGGGGVFRPKSGKKY